MKWIGSTFFTFALLTFFSQCTFCNAGEKSFYVSHSGNDSWSGKVPSPDKAGKNGPFATLEKAREAVRSEKKSGESAITVYIRAGEYEIPSTLQFGADDSGTKKSPVIWKAYPGEKVSVIGGKKIVNFKPLDYAAVGKSVQPQFKDKIFQADLKELGITNYGEQDPASGKKMELFFNGKFMDVARYPNDKWLIISDVPLKPGHIFKGDTRTEQPDGSTVGQHSGAFCFDDNRPFEWPESAFENMWMHGYWYWDWRDAFQKVDKIDRTTREVTFKEPFHFYGYRKGQRFYFLNLLEELDTPGEYYVDMKKGILYFWPPSDINKGSAYLSTSENFMISLKGASNIEFQGIKFMVSRGGAIDIQGGENNTIAGCVFTNFGQTVINISGGKNNGITGCDIFEVATVCLSIDGGDRKALIPAGNYAVNNHLFDFCKILRIGGAVSLKGVGNILAHNKIHNAPHHAVNFGGNENIIEYNEIYDVLKETDDAGSVYSGRDWTLRGNVIRYNYFHDIKGYGKWNMSVYLDDCYCSALVFGNVFYKAGKAVLIGGGQHNTVENNLFINCDISIHVDARGMWDPYYLKNLGDGNGWGMLERLAEIDYKKAPWSTKYPELIQTVENPCPPAGNVITRNISYGGRFLDFYKGADFKIVKVENNIIADREICSWEKIDSDSVSIYKNGDPEIAEQIKNNIVTSGNPGFVDIAHGNFNLKNNSQAGKIGFKKIPFDKIGLYTDKYRKMIPSF